MRARTVVGGFAGRFIQLLTELSQCASLGMRPSVRGLVAMLSLILFSGLAQAIESQFYLVARTAPDSSIVRTAQDSTVVYLRWDSLEGQLPDDVASLRLKRTDAGGNTAEILPPTPVDAVMTAAEISQLYQSPSQQRRLQETISRMKEYAAGNDDFADFNTGQFASALRNLIQTDAIWGYFGSRNDFNVARARYRGLLDRPGVGTFTYELEAISDTGTATRLGKVTVDTNNPSSVPPAENFTQVSQARCDAPEYALDHHTVSLQWQSPGASDANVTEQVASQVAISGYDLYRSTSNLAPGDPVPDRNIAQQAGQASADHRGVPQISGLEKVNDILLTVTPDRSGSPEWVESLEELKRAGVEPGDRRAYYLVPRDFTGNYGPTVKTAVTVPNLHRPPQPWNIRTIVDQNTTSGDQMALSFDEVNLENYQAAYGQSRTFCNLAEASQTGVLEYVGPDGDCQTDLRRKVRLDVNQYRIYRFSDFRTASKFRDSDGDGFADADERKDSFQCNSQKHPSSGVTDYSLDSGDVEFRTVTLPETGRVRQVMRDRSPVTNVGQASWYRIAAVTADGRASRLSPPQRALYPDRSLPNRPTVTTERSGRALSDCSVAQTDNGDWQFEDNIGLYDEVGISCDGGQSQITLSSADFTNAAACQDILSACGKAASASLTYSPNAAKGAFQCTTTIPNPGRLCDLGTLSLNPVYSEGQVAVDEPGQLVGPEVSVTATTADPDTCVSIYRVMSDGDKRVATSCGSQTPDEVEYVADAGLMCGYAVTQDDNNNVSPPEAIPCTLVRPEGAQRKTPSTPQPVSFDVGGQQAFVSWRLPVEPVAVTMARLEQTPEDGDSVTKVVSVPAAGRGAGGIQNRQIPVPALSGSEDRWCVSLKSVGPAQAEEKALTSEWSSPRCMTRTSAGPAPEPTFMPWPDIPPARKGQPLEARYGLELVAQGTEPASEDAFYAFFDLATVDFLHQCSIEGEPSFSNPDGTKDKETKTSVFREIQCPLYNVARIQGALASELSMMVYRQRRDSAGQLHDWIQVSPLLEYAHWERFKYSDPETDAVVRQQVLRDPWIRLREGDTAGEWILTFTDRYPYINGHDYRYQVVYFTEDHRISRWRQSDWVTPDVTGGTLSVDYGDLTGDDIQTEVPTDLQGSGSLQEGF